MGIKRKNSLLFISDAQKQVLLNAVNTFGEQAQMDMVIEEMAELTKALLKMRRKPHGSTQLDVLEEFADVLIMLLQLDFMMVDYDPYHTHFYEFIDSKIERLNDRLPEEFRVELPKRGKSS